MAQFGGGPSKPGIFPDPIGSFDIHSTSDPICGIVDLITNCECLTTIEWGTNTGNCATAPITGYQIRYISQQGTNNEWVIENLPSTTTKIDFKDILANTPSENEPTFISIYATRDEAKSSLMYFVYYDGDNDGTCNHVPLNHPGNGDPNSEPVCQQTPPTGADIEVMVIDLQDVEEAGGTCNSSDLSIMAFDDLSACIGLGKTNNKTVKNWMATNHPNPFTTYNIVELSISKTSPVSITLYDIQGKPINTLLQNEIIEKGEHIFTLDGKDLPIGVYYYEIVIDGSSSIQRILKM